MLLWILLDLITLRILSFNSLSHSSVQSSQRGLCLHSSRDHILYYFKVQRDSCRLRMNLYCGMFTSKVNKLLDTWLSCTWVHQLTFVMTRASVCTKWTMCADTFNHWPCEERVCSRTETVGQVPIISYNGNLHFDISGSCWTGDAKEEEEWAKKVKQLFAILTIYLLSLGAFCGELISCMVPAFLYPIMAVGHLQLWYLHVNFFDCPVLHLISWVHLNLLTLSQLFLQVLIVLIWGMEHSLNKIPDFHVNVLTFWCLLDRNLKWQNFMDKLCHLFSCLQSIIYKTSLHIYKP